MIQQTDMRPGDILLLLDTPDNTSIKHKGIKYGQKLTGINLARHNQGAADLVHAMIMVEYDCVAEASGGEGAVRAATLKFRQGTYVVFRCTDNALADRASTAAMTWSQHKDMGYAKRKAVMSVFHSDKLGTHGMARAQAYHDQINEMTPTFGRGRAFCSEFVLACYQAAAIELGGGVASAHVLQGPVLGCDAKHCSVRALHDRLLSDNQFSLKGILEVT